MRITDERWKYLRSLATWNVHEAILICLGIEPDHYDDDYHDSAGERMTVREHFCRDCLVRWEKTPDGGLVLSDDRHPPDKWITSFRKLAEFPFPVPTPKSEGSDKITTTERNTHLVVIAALCHHAKIDFGNRGTATELSRMTEELGAPVSDDTVRRLLLRIPEALESRRK
jgi:hypothetical protein